MDRNDVITIVSGLPRSGTSMMMSMLEAGGIAPLIDGIRSADDDNPKGYYEFERVKKIKDDTAWLADARGKVVKIISQLLLHLPDGYEYKVLFMRRNIKEILASQQEMMKRRGSFKPGGPSDEEMGKMLLVHADQVVRKIGPQSCVDFIEVDYNDMLKEPARHITRINQFLGGHLSEPAMSAVVDKSLYRQRK